MMFAAETATPITPDKLGVNVDANCGGSDTSACLKLLASTDDMMLPAGMEMDEEIINEERLNAGCERVAFTCATGFVCVPKLGEDKGFLPPAVVGAAYLNHIKDGLTKAQAIAGVCIARRVLLHHAFVHTTVAASLAFRIALAVTGNAIAAGINASVASQKIFWSALFLGLVKQGDTFDTLCTKLGTPEQCQAIKDLDALEKAREVARKAKQEEPELPLTREQLKAFLEEEVTMEEENGIGAIAAGMAPGIFDKPEDKGVKDIFVDLQKVNMAIKDAMAMNTGDDKIKEGVIAAAVIARRQLVKLAAYAVLLRTYNNWAATFLSADNDLVKQVNMDATVMAACPTPLQPDQACLDARAMKLKALVADAVKNTIGASLVINVARIRGRFVARYLDNAAKTVRALWVGVVRCVVFFKAHEARIRQAFVVGKTIQAALKAHEDDVKEVVAQWVIARAILRKWAMDKSAELTAKWESLSAEDKEKLLAALTIIKAKHAIIRAKLVAAWGAAKVARAVVCRRRLKKAIAFKLRGVCLKSDDAEACRDRVVAYFNGLKDKIVANKDQIAKFKQEHLKCWPLIRLQVGVAVVAGAFQAAAGMSPEEAVASDPCNTVADGQCGEVEGKLWIPADCSAAEPAVGETTDVPLDPTEVENSGDATTDAVDLTPVTGDLPPEMTRKRAVAEVRAAREALDEAMSTEIAAMLSGGDPNGLTATLADDAEVDVMKDDYSMPVDELMIQPPGCNTLGADPNCGLGVAEAPVVTPPAGTPAAGTPERTATDDMSSSSAALSAALAVAVACVLALV